jgi:hypothetical protein
MAKMPTLNVDVRVNTRTMQKDIDAANKQLQNIGGKGLAFAGGTAGKLGSLGALGGTAGSAAIGAGAAALTAAAPFMIANRVIDSFSSSVQNATQFLEKQQSDMTASSWRELGISQMFAERLAAAAERADQLSASNKGMWDSFWAAASNDQGQLGGVLGGVVDASQSTMDSLKQVSATLGAMLGGKNPLAAFIEGIQAVTPSGDFSRELQAAGSVGDAIIGFGSDSPQARQAAIEQAPNILALGQLMRPFMDLFG